MLEFINTNLDNREPEYFYRVREYVSTMKEDPGKNDAFEHMEDFKGPDLMKCRAEAINWFHERHIGLIKRGEYFLPFASPADFVLGKNACYSIDIYLVEYFSEDDYWEYNLVVDTPEEKKEILEFERYVLEKNRRLYI